jgi:hypothetical protein
MATPGPGGWEQVNLQSLGLPEGDTLTPSPTGAITEPPVAPVDLPPVEPTSEPVPDGAPVEAVEPEPEPDEASETEPQGDDAEVELPDGSHLTVRRLRELAQIDNVFQTSPDIQRRVMEAIQPVPASQGEREPQGATTALSAPPAAVTPPPEFDLEDPAIKYLWTAQQQQQAEFARLQQVIDQQQRTAQFQQQQYAQSGMAAARHNIATRYGLNPDEVAAIEQKAARVVNLEGLLADHGGSIEQAGVAAMETAIALDPQLRSRLSKTADTPADKQRKTRLSSLAGTSGGAPRIEPAPTPMTPQQRQEAMAAELDRAATGQQA